MFLLIDSKNIVPSSTVQIDCYRDCSVTLKWKPSGMKIGGRYYALHTLLK